MNWMDLVKAENIIYLIIVILVLVLTIVKQFKKQFRSQDDFSKQILMNLEKIEIQNNEILKLIEVHAEEISKIKSELCNLKSRLSLLEKHDGEVLR
ncbi:MAG TPA: hypothetical protein VIK77_01920 [Tissierellaceae bacterium]